MGKEPQNTNCPTLLETYMPTLHPVQIQQHIISPCFPLQQHIVS